MNKKIIYIAAIALPVFIMARMPEQLSFGAPVSSSGAPDEVTCATSGCHDDSKINNGNALLSVEVGNSITKYVPGQTYPIKVKISESNVNRFGFQIVALKDNDHLNAGNMIITDNIRTQVRQNDIALMDRQYVTYTYQGTEPYVPGVGEWTFNWTAPEKNEGPVTLYIASVSANNDNSDKGDHVYTTSLKLSPNDQTSINDNTNEFNNISVTNVSNELLINIRLSGEKQIKCDLYNVQGSLVKTLFDEKLSVAEKRIAADVPKGVYFVRLMAGQNKKTTKIIIQ